VSRTNTGVCVAVAVRRNEPEMGEWILELNTSKSECLRVVRTSPDHWSWKKLMWVIGRFRSVPGPSSRSFFPRAAQTPPPTCNASYTLLRRGQWSGMSRLQLEDEVGELRPPACQLLLIRRVRFPFQRCMVCSDQPRHACYVANYDRGRYCSVEEAGGRGIHCRGCFTRNSASWVSELSERHSHVPFRKQTRLR